MIAVPDRREAARGRDPCVGGVVCCIEFCGESLAVTLGGYANAEMQTAPIAMGEDGCKWRCVVNYSKEGGADELARPKQ